MIRVLYSVFIQLKKLLIFNLAAYVTSENVRVMIIQRNLSSQFNHKFSSVTAKLTLNTDSTGTIENLCYRIDGPVHRLYRLVWATPINPVTHGSRMASMQSV